MGVGTMHPLKVHGATSSTQTQHNTLDLGISGQSGAHRPEGPGGRCVSAADLRLATEVGRAGKGGSSEAVVRLIPQPGSHIHKYDTVLTAHAGVGAVLR